MLRGWACVTWLCLINSGLSDPRRAVPGSNQQLDSMEIGEQNRLIQPWAKWYNFTGWEYGRGSGSKKLQCSNAGVSSGWWNSGIDGVLGQCVPKGGEGHGGRTTAPNGKGLELLEMRCFLRTTASTLVAHWNCLSSFKNIGIWVPSPENQIQLCGLWPGCLKAPWQCC